MCSILKSFSILKVFIFMVKVLFHFHGQTMPLYTPPLIAQFAMYFFSIFIFVMSLITYVNTYTLADGTSFLFCAKSLFCFPYFHLHSLIILKFYSFLKLLFNCISGTTKVNLVKIPSTASSPRDTALAAVICSALATVLLALLILCVIYCKRQFMEKKPSCKFPVITISL